jgi:hypothetical protein
LNKIKEAEQVVAPHVHGPLLAWDSAEQVYAQGLRALGYTGTVYNGSAKPMFELLKKQPRRSSGMAMDAAQQQEFAKRFPNATKLKQR